MKNLKRIIFILGIFFFGIGAAGILCAQNVMDPGERNMSYSGPDGVTLRGSPEGV